MLPSAAIAALLTYVNNAAIAADGSIYVANSAQLAIPGSSGGIIRIDPVTGVQTAVTTDGLLYTAVAVVIEADGNLAALDYTNGLVRVDSTTGAQTFVSDFRNPDQGPVLTYAIGLVVEPSGDYLVSDGPRDGIDGVYRIDRDTGFRTLVTSGGSLDGIYGLALESTGQVVVINNGTIDAGSVVRVDPTTGAQSVLASGFAGLVSIAVAPDGSIFVTDAGNFTGTLSRVYRIDPVTGSRSIVSTQSSGSRYYTAIAIESSGSIVVSESAGNYGGDLNNIILRLTPPATPIGVVVNLRLGTASGLTGGIANIQNVVGSAGDDILVGNGGNVLTGGAGRDVLIAGASASILFGGDGDDLLIGGTTDYDRDAAALLAVRAEWARRNADYATRVANLSNGTNGAPRLDDTTVRANGRRNTLTGNAGRDLFFNNRNRDVLDRDPLTEDFVPIFVG